ncbi:MAG: redoxin domain-containing protein [Cellvibrionaceae bacterium]
MKTIPRCLFTLITVLSLSFFSALTSAGKFNSIISIGDTLPAFDNLSGVDGGKHSSKNIEEDILVLVSLSNTCPFSNGIEKDLINLVNELKNESVKFIGVNYNMNKLDNLNAMQERKKHYHYNFSYLKDSEQTLGRQLGTTVTPEFFVFNKDRKLIYTGLLHNSPAMSQGGKSVYLKGNPTEFYVRNAIFAATKNKTLTIEETRPYGCSVEYSSALESAQH